MTVECPVCHEMAEMLCRVAVAHEPHGETHVDEYAQCSCCHARIPWDDVADALAEEEFGALAEADVREGGIQ